MSGPRISVGLGSEENKERWAANGVTLGYQLSSGNVDWGEMCRAALRQMFDRKGLGSVKRPFGFCLGGNAMPCALDTEGDGDCARCAPHRTGDL